MHQGPMRGWDALDRQEQRSSFFNGKYHQILLIFNYINIYITTVYSVYIYYSDIHIYLYIYILIYILIYIYTISIYIYM